jgi:rubredoxin
MSKLDLWVCTVCEYVYDPYMGDPDNDVNAGTPFCSLPFDWVCPVCGAVQDDFVPYFEHAEHGISEELAA